MSKFKRVSLVGSEELFRPTRPEVLETDEIINDALDRLGDKRTPTREDWARLSAAWREDLDDRIAQLQGLRDRLTGCIGCGCLSIDRCRLANPNDILGAEGQGPRKLLG